MILEGNQRGGAKNLALHLMKQENEHVDVHELRGFVSQDLMGALNEAYAISRGTRCKQFLYSLSLNPPPHENVTIADFEAAIEKAEQALNLTGQPRAIVFHEKEGRRHAHAVWSRIDIQNMKAIQMSYDHTKLQDVSRELYLDHGWKMPRGFARGSECDPKNFTLADWQQAKRADKDPRDIEIAIQDAWAISDSKTSFSHALQERGYALARGDRRGFVAVDLHGEVYSIPRKTGVKTKDVRLCLGDAQDLSSVEDTRHKIAKDMLPIMQKFKDGLQVQEDARKSEFTNERENLVTKQRAARQNFIEQINQRQQQDALKRQSRFRSGFKGIWDRLRGEHNRIAGENERAATLALARDRAEKDVFINNQLAQRRMFGQWKLAMKQNFHEQRQELENDHSQFKDMQNNDFETRRDSFKRSRKKTPHRNRDPMRGPER